LVPRIPAGKSANVEVLILKAIARKQAKGGAAYASGKTLVVFTNAGNHTKWFPNRVARQLPGTVDFAAVWVVALQTVEADGAYVYGVTSLDLSAGNAPTSLLAARATQLGVSPEDAERQDFAPDSPRGNAICRMVDVSEIAFGAVFLASDKAWAVSGELVAATGRAGRTVFY
jgi:hypothetical protein